MYEPPDRFEILIFETAGEYLAKKKIEYDKQCQRALKEKYAIEDAGVCQGCGSDEMPRWVRDEEFFLCYLCFYHDLDCESSVMVPMHRVDQMEDYIDESTWEGLWEEENDIA